MSLQKQAFLRINIERMLFSEALKLRPELRPNAYIINRIEKLIDLPRIERILKRPLDPDDVRKMARQAEAVYSVSLIKSICMTEIEEENPRFTQFVKGFKVKRNALLKARYYALQSYEDNGGPIDHLVSKKQAIDLMKSVSILDKTHFFVVQKYINWAKLFVVDQTPLFEYPLSDTVAR